ncbi:hypothetical protein BDV93DRAFT_521913 [Ceratobasidium sp. AG-I]|nr:hypothetical protein BDV93DRAFT_521913 [Ceratobasidium sp. AG-I]
MQNSDSSASNRPPNIMPAVAAPTFQWTLKTQDEQDEEYLSRLEARLKHIQQPDPSMRDTRPQNSSPAMEESVDTSDDETSSANGTFDNEHSPRDAPPPMDDDPGIHLLYDHNPTSETSPKALPGPLPGTISPAHIVVVDPPDPADPTAIIPPDANNSPERDPEHDPEEDDQTEHPPRAKLVHFRSRVRIASSTHIRNSELRSSRSSSISESSSLSAPLRGPAEESVLAHGAARRLFGVGPVSAAHAAGNGIRPGESLSEMMSSEAASLWLNRRKVGGPKRGGRARRNRGRVVGDEANTDPDEDDVDERSPLAKRARTCYGATPQMTTAVAREIDVDAELDRARRAARKTEEDVIFGPWPQRLTNWNWWVYKIEHYTCGLCADDPYAE